MHVCVTHPNNAWKRRVIRSTFVRRVIFVFFVTFEIEGNLENIFEYGTVSGRSPAQSTADLRRYHTRNGRSSRSTNLTVFPAEKQKKKKKTPSKYLKRSCTQSSPGGTRRIKRTLGIQQDIGTKHDKLRSPCTSRTRCGCGDGKKREHQPFEVRGTTEANDGEPVVAASVPSAAPVPRAGRTRHCAVYRESTNQRTVSKRRQSRIRRTRRRNNTSRVRISSDFQRIDTLQYSF